MKEEDYFKKAKDIVPLLNGMTITEAKFVLEKAILLLSQSVVTINPESLIRV